MHSMAECYAVLTRLPIIPKISPSIAHQIITENVAKIATLITLNESQYLSGLQHLANLGLSGGIIYDALILKCAEKAKADKLLTLNTKDFMRLCPGNKDYIIEP